MKGLSTRILNLVLTQKWWSAPWWVLPWTGQNCSFSDYCLTGIWKTNFLKPILVFLILFCRKNQIRGSQARLRWCKAMSEGRYLIENVSTDSVLQSNPDRYHLKFLNVYNFAKTMYGTPLKQSQLCFSYKISCDCLRSVYFHAKIVHVQDLWRYIFNYEKHKK